MARIIDSNVLVELERQGQRPIDLQSIVKGESPAIASITAAELLVGVELARTPERRRTTARFISDLLEQVDVLAFDLEAARVHARLRAHLKSSGQAVGEFDLLIAATALANDCDVVTLNGREFNRVPGLRVIVPEL